MIYTFIVGRCSDLPVSACCRVMKVTTSGFYQWKAQPVSDRDWDDAVLTNTIVDIHRMSRRSYGSPRVHSELRLALHTFCSRKRVERLMRQARVAGIYRRRGHGCTKRDPGAELNDDVVSRQFDPDSPDRLWVMDVTEHPTDTGKLSCAVVLDGDSAVPVCSAPWVRSAIASITVSPKVSTRHDHNSTHPSVGPGEAHFRQTDTVAHRQGSPVSVAVEQPRRWRDP